MKAYLGVYIDYHGLLARKGERVMQVKECVDALSNEMLATPGLIEVNVTSHGDLLINAKKTCNGT